MLVAFIYIMDGIITALQQGITPALVVAIYLIIVKIIDNKKEATQTRLNSELIKSINNISQFIADMTKNVIEKDKDKCKIAVEDAMYSSGMRLLTFASSTVVNNHIEVNKETVLANIHSIVNSEYYNIFQTLSLYKINDKRPSDMMKREWIDEIENIIVKIIYNDKLNKEDKILAVNNRINLKFQNYISYIVNNVA